MSAPLLVVRDDDPTPPFEQVRRQLAALIVAGTLAPEQRLPPLRQLAGDLGLAVGTVARSYRELEAAGLVVSRRGGGTRVAAGAADGHLGVAVPGASLASPLDDLVGEVVARARALGAGDAEISAALAQALAPAHVASSSGPAPESAARRVRSVSVVPAFPLVPRRC